MKVKDVLEDGKSEPEYLDELMLTEDGTVVQILEEGRKWVAGRFESNIGIDQPTYRAGEGLQHAHVLGRRGEELGVVNVNGTSSHGSKFKLHDADAAELRRRGFNIRADNIVEWIGLRARSVRILFD